MKTQILFILSVSFLLPCLGVWGQEHPSAQSRVEYCRKTEVFFDFGANALSPSGKRTLDSLSREFGNQPYYLEVFGHTDSVDTDSFNFRLSQERVETVSQYLHSKHPQLEIKSEFFGESMPYAAASPEAWQNRRVEIFAIPMEGDLLQFKGKKGESFYVGKILFGNCSICDQAPEVLTFLNAEEAAAGGTPLVTDQGILLRTAGMSWLNFTGNSCHDTFAPARIRIPSAAPIPGIGVWDYDAKTGRWVEGSGEISYEDGFYEIATPDYRLNTGKNGDLRFNLSSSCKFEISESGLTGRLKSNVFPKGKEKEENISFFSVEGGKVRVPCEKNQIRSLRSEKGAYFYLNASLNDLIDSTEVQTRLDMTDFSQFSDTILQVRLEASDYEKLPSNERQISVKTGKKVQSVAFHLEELDLDIPLERRSKRRFNAQDFPLEYKLKVKSSGEEQIIQSGKLKIREKKKYRKVRIRKRHLK